MRYQPFATAFMGKLYYELKDRDAIRRRNAALGTVQGRQIRPIRSTNRDKS